MLQILANLLCQMLRAISNTSDGFTQVLTTRTLHYAGAATAPELHTARPITGGKYFPISHVVHINKLIVCEK